MKNYYEKNVNIPYKYGFNTNFKYINSPTGLSKFIILLIKKPLIKYEASYTYRLKNYEIWVNKLKNPNWLCNLPNVFIDLKIIRNTKYYIEINETMSNNKIPKPNKETKESIINSFQQLGIPLTNNISMDKISIDAIFDHSSIVTTNQKRLYKIGIIFCSIQSAEFLFCKLFAKFNGLAITPQDNYFAALNSFIFTDGSFCYIPQNIQCPMDLSTYFRINAPNAGQFEKTLIITEKNSKINYLEGCTAAINLTKQLHAAVVELISFDNSCIKYATIQNWYEGNEEGLGGIYNFVTKRGLALGNFSNISWTQVETGAAITWKYPSCVLVGHFSKGFFYSIALTNNKKIADTGTKMIHIGKKCKSIIISKSVIDGMSINNFRGLIKICPNSTSSTSFAQCDSFMLNKYSSTCTYPYIISTEATGNIEHEATISKLSEDKVFFLQQRCLTKEQAIFLILTGFCKSVLIKMPFEYVAEANLLIKSNYCGSIG